MKVLSYTKDDNQFYPTPRELADHIRSKYFGEIRRANSRNIKVLDPSAGKGDLLFAFSDCDCYAVEIDPHLQAILRSREIKVIGSDWMQLKSSEVFDAVVMNPPFAYAEKHFIKAIEDFKYTSAKIVCIMNANTVRNPSRDMKRMLSDYNIEVEYMSNAFSSAERKTDVEIAICSISMMRADNSYESLIDDLDFIVKDDDFIIDESSDIEKRNNFDIDREVKRYNEDVHNTKRMYHLFNTIRNSVGGIFFNADVTLSEAINRIRNKYWRNIISIDAFAKHMTRDDAWEMREFIENNRDLEFNYDNVYKLLQETIKKASKSIEDTVMELFDKITNRHAYNRLRRNNVHLYNGWKTNEGIAVKRRFIIPLMYDNPFSGWGDKRSLHYKAKEVLKDIELCLTYFATNVERIFLNDDYVKHGNEDLSEIESDLLHVRIYQKGTAHITVKDDDVLRRFNIFAGRKIGALPFDYGTKDKSEMSDEEIKVSKAFEGNKYKREDNIVAVNMIDFKA